VTDDPVESERLAREALAIGRAGGNADLELLAMTAVGGALVQQGRIAEGMALLDEAMAAALGGECGDQLTVAHASCMTMLVCSSHFDIERATQWLQATERFIDRYGCPFLYAECRTHYGRVLFENGDWDAAERFLTEAISMSQGNTPASHALASGTLAELRLAQGRIEDAAHVLEGLEGRAEAVVAAATLHLVRNQPSEAATILRRRTDAVGSNRLDVAAVIELLGEAEIALGAGEAAAERARSPPPRHGPRWRSLRISARAVAPTRPPAVNVGARHKEDLIQELTRLAAQAGRPEPGELAAEVALIIDGATVQAVLAPDPASRQRIVRRGRRIAEALLTPGGQP
jgi:tetratricopeptide (TPR) repeat protein